MKARLRRSSGVSTAAVATATEKVDESQVTFETLYRESRDDVYAYVAGLLRDRSAAEEVTAQAFERAWRRRRQIDRQRGTPRSWLFGIARNVVAEHQRRAFRRRWVALDEAPEGAVDFEGQILSQHVLVEELGRLPETQREVLMLRFVAGLSARDVGTAVGKSESAVVSLQVRGLDALRRRLGRLA